MIKTPKVAKKNSPKCEFSKRIAIIVTYSWVGSIIFSAISFWIKGQVSQDIITATSTALGIIVTGYYGKAGVENIQKIKENHTEI